MEDTNKILFRTVKYILLTDSYFKHFEKLCLTIDSFKLTQAQLSQNLLYFYAFVCTSLKMTLQKTKHVGQTQEVTNWLLIPLGK